MSLSWRRINGFVVIKRQKDELDYAVEFRMILSVDLAFA